MFERHCEPLPPPQPDEFNSIAEWASDSDIADREHDRALADLAAQIRERRQEQEQ
jgi:hypothetical protein